MKSDELRKLSEAAAPAPWHWWYEDHSMLMLTGPDEMRDHVLSTYPCKFCQDEEKTKSGWPDNYCMTPNRAERDLITYLRNHAADFAALLDAAEKCSLDSTQSIDECAANLRSLDEALKPFAAQPSCKPT